jgi:hypothetical protein
MKKFLSAIIGIVLSFTVMLFLADTAYAASLWLSPTSGTYGKNAMVKVNVGVDTAGEAINAVQANINYPADKLQFSSVSTSGSALTIFAEKTGGGGVVRIAGGIPSPGITGSKFIAVVYFKVLADSGTATLTFTGDSSVLKNSDNSEALSARGSSTFTLSGTSAATGTDVSQNAQATAGQSQLTISEVAVGDLGKKSATITWVTSKEADSTVNYGPTDELVFSQSGQETTTEHQLILDPALLTPGTLYYYKVKSSTTDGETAESELMQFNTLGYTVMLKVLDSEGMPVEGANVELYSSPRTAVTDENGEAMFENVSPGKHGVIVKHEGKTIIQDIEVAEEEDTPQNFQLSFAPETEAGSLMNSFVYGLVGVVAFALVLGVLIVVVMRIRKRKMYDQSSTDSSSMSENTSSDDGEDSGPPEPPIITT